MLLKLTFNDQIHLYKGQLNLETIKKHCQSVFKALPSKFEFSYIDADGDQITINSQTDMDILTQLNQLKSLKLFIRQLDTSFEEIGSENEEAEENQCFEQLVIEAKGIGSMKNKWSYFKLQKQREDREEKELEIKDAVNKFLEETQRNILDKFIKQEENTIKEEVENFMEEITANCCEKICQQEEEEENFQKFRCKRKILKKSVINPQISEYVSVQQINQLVDAKVNELLPGIINKITKNIQHKCRNSCDSSQSELEFQKEINQQLLRKLRSKQSHI